MCVSQLSVLLATTSISNGMQPQNATTATITIMNTTIFAATTTTSTNY